MTQPSEPQQRIELRIGEDMEGGVYANMLGVWHSAFEFTLDFAATLPVQPGEDERGNATVDVPARVVARVKLPPAAMFAVIRTLNENMTNYEAAFGGIQAPDSVGPDPVYPPDGP
jgi:hypothetical protein